jgi:hypothetical protein
MPSSAGLPEDFWGETQDEVTQTLMGIVLVRMLERGRARASRLVDEGHPIHEVEAGLNELIYKVTTVADAFGIKVVNEHKGESE